MPPQATNAQKPFGPFEAVAFISVGGIIDLFQFMVGVIFPPLFAAALLPIVLGLAGGAAGGLAGAATGAALGAIGQALGSPVTAPLGLGVGLIFASMFGLFLSVIAFAVLGLWCFKRGTPLLRRLGLGAAIEVTPVVGSFAPAWTITACLTVMNANGISIGRVLSTIAGVTPIGRGAAAVAGPALKTGGARASAATMAGKTRAASVLPRRSLSLERIAQNTAARDKSMLESRESLRDTFKKSRDERDENVRKSLDYWNNLSASAPRSMGASEITRRHEEQNTKADRARASKKDLV